MSSKVWRGKHVRTEVTVLKVSNECKSHIIENTQFNIHLKTMQENKIQINQPKYN